MANQNTQQAKKAQSFNENWQGWNAWSNWPNWQNWSNMADLGKSSAKFMDYGRLRQTASRNAEAVTGAHQVALECVQAIARRTNEVMQENAKQSWECFRDSCSSKSAEDAQYKNSDYFSCLLQNCCGNAREVTEITAKAAVEIVDLWNKRATEAISEWTSSK